MSTLNKSDKLFSNNNHTTQVPASDPIPSRYNFVPLSSNIFFPDWASLSSMDVPYSDGISGTIKIRVTAKTPIYIRNGGDHPKDETRLDNNEYLDFFRVSPKGLYAIPGTSIKGMLRGVIEVASFGKIAGTKGASSRVSDHRYAVRDLQNRPLYTDRITEIIDGAFKPKVQAAWLSRDTNGKWFLRICDFARIEQSEIEKLLEGDHFIGQRGPAENKYRIIKSLKIKFDCDELDSHHHSENKMLIYRKATNLGTGNRDGVLVLTGQPSTRDGKPGKKHMEFIFFDEKQELIEVPEIKKTEFEFAHSELGENRKPNTEWKFWKSQMKAGNRIPVFVLFEENKLHSMGLAMMYRFPYKYSIHETISHTGEGNHMNNALLDLGETIFGFAEDKDALRGRVSIETCIAENDPETMPIITTVLSSPKPTYYPNYVKQRANPVGEVVGDAYTTYMDDTAEIRGWKRYIIHADCTDLTNVDEPPTDKNGHQILKVATRFRPLPAGTIFNGTLHVHNLRPIELGALKWAMTWGDKAELRHSLGMGKPYGFGSVILEIVSADLNWCNPDRSDKPILADCQNIFYKTMDTWHKTVQGNTKWSESDQIRALRNMANPSATWKYDVRYPKLGKSIGENEFAQQKKRMHALLLPLDAVQLKKEHKAARIVAPLVNKPISVSPAQDLIVKAIAMKDKELRKKLNSLQSLTQAEYDKLFKAIAKRPDAAHKEYLREDRDWSTALENLKSRTK